MNGAHKISDGSNSGSEAGTSGNGFKKINVLISGLPGNMATLDANKITKQEDMELAHIGLTGEGIVEKTPHIVCEDGSLVALFAPQAHKQTLESYKEQVCEFIIVDFTAPPIKGLPSPAKGNAELYCSLKIPFIVGSTMPNEDSEMIKKMVADSGNLAVIAPNMAAPIIIFQEMMEYIAKKYPGVLKDYMVSLSESHQAGKKDTSGTMRSVLKSIQKLGVPVEEKDIEMIRDPAIQENEFGIPKEYLGGHGYHWYNFTSLDGTVFLDFSHKVNGRDVYATGTLAAIRFLNKRIQEGIKGKAYSMIDVLSGQ